MHYLHHAKSIAARLDPTALPSAWAYLQASLTQAEQHLDDSQEIFAATAYLLARALEEHAERTAALHSELQTAQGVAGHWRAEADRLAAENAHAWEAAHHCRDMLEALRTQTEGHAATMAALEERLQAMEQVAAQWRLTAEHLEADNDRAWATAQERCAELERLRSAR